MSSLTSLLDINLPHNTLILLCGTILLSAVYFTRFLTSYVRKPKYPIVGTVDSDFREVIERGVARIPVLILPKWAVDDIKKLPDSICNSYDVFKGDFYYKFTGFPESSKLIISVVKNDLNRNIPDALNQLQDELKHSFDKEFGQCQDWKSLILYQNIARLVAYISGRVLVGRPLSRSNEWVDINVSYTSQLVIVRDALYKWPVFMREIVAPHLKEVKSIKRFRERVSELIRPLIDDHLAKKGGEKLYSEYGDEKGRSIAWLLSRMDPKIIPNVNEFCDNILLTSFASIHTTSNAIIQAIFDLASYREYIPILQEEIQDIIREEGSNPAEECHSQLSKSSLTRLSKLDSFLKESQRMNNSSLSITPMCEALVDFKLSNGCLIPKRTRIAIPAWAIHHQSTSLFSPGLTKPLSEFDGLRFHNLRRLPGNENRYYFVSTSPESLSFGHGNHACPGRFFAGSEIKLVLLEFLLNWEFRFPEDEKLQGGAWRRPKNKFIETTCSPDLQARIEIKRKKI